jgi:hypothetical protein
MNQLQGNYFNIIDNKLYNLLALCSTVTKIRC